MRAATALILAAVLLIPAVRAEERGPDYLYYRDVNVPPYQKLREFFDLPDRPGRYEITLVSDAVGPLTLRLLRVRGEEERVVVRKRSYHIGSHEFHEPFDNSAGHFDLIVEIANSNPADMAKVSVYVIELPQ